jgi:NAD(P)-dependent dehydrogenase (short-subunit alcohol dehydrogenase family)
VQPLISTGSLTRSSLADRVAIVTGAGRGIGFETARALAWLGAHVAIAEIDEVSGASASEKIVAEMGDNSAAFIPTDVGDGTSLGELLTSVNERFGPVDIVVNNATIAPFGPIASTAVSAWDASYRVNLRGPVTLARLTVPPMVERRRGVFVVLSSVGGAYMAPYEAMKSAQVELVSALAEELDGTGVFAFAIGPGQVMTPGLQEGVETLAPLYGMSIDEFLALNEANQISAEEAGAGIAAAIVFSERFHGTQTASPAGLVAAGIRLVSATHATQGSARGAGRHERAVYRGESASEACRKVRATLADEIEGWQDRGLFERKWMERDFGQAAGMRAEDALAQLDRLQANLDAGHPGQGWRVLLPALRRYYDHYAGLARGYTKDPEQLKSQLDAIARMRSEVERLEMLLASSR